MLSPRPEMFPRRALVNLLAPLLIEQLLAITIGMVATFMVSNLGESAVSAVSLVENINLLLTQVFAALATGGAVISAQYLGRGDHRLACDAAKQLMIAVIAVSLVVTAMSLAFTRGILSLVFGGIDDEIMGYAITYFALSALSYPFLAIHNAGAALFRSMNESKVPMYLSILMNVINVASNYYTIFYLHWGVGGAATSALLARAVGAAIMLSMIVRPSHTIYIDRIYKLEFKPDMVRRILRIGLPNGLEGGMFQIGKLLVASLISTFGTPSIAANAIANTVASISNVPGSAISLGVLTVVGQCVGAGDYDQAVKYTKKLMKTIFAMMVVTNLAVLATLNPLLGAFHMSAEAFEIARSVLVVFSVTSILFWPPAFGLPAALRAAGDASMTMMVSIVSMWVFRIGFSYLLCGVFGMGVMGVWIAMVIDWVVRGAAYTARFATGGWRSKRVI